MRTLGLLGGMSWESTLPYYRIINERVRERLGGLHSAEMFLYSVDFAEIEHLQQTGDWDAAGRMLAGAAQALERAGSEALVIGCTNTMHKVLDAIEPAIGIPVLHIADATAQCVRARNIAKVGLLGTRFTMEQDFYRGRLERNALDVAVPDAEQRAEIHRIIYDELCQGVDSRRITRGSSAGHAIAGRERCAGSDPRLHRNRFARRRRGHERARVRHRKNPRRSVLRTGRSGTETTGRQSARRFCQAFLPRVAGVEDAAASPVGMIRSATS